MEDFVKQMKTYKEGINDLVSTMNHLKRVRKKTGNTNLDQSPTKKND